MKLLVEAENKLMWNDITNLLSKYWENYLNGTLATIVLSFVGTFGGLFLGIFLAYFKSLKTKVQTKYIHFCRRISVIACFRIEAFIFGCAEQVGCREVNTQVFHFELA